MNERLEQDYDTFLDDVDPDDIKILSELTDDVGLKEAFWELYQQSKDVLDYFGRHDFSSEIKQSLCSLIYNMQAISDEYEERLENNDELTERLEEFLAKVPGSFWQVINNKSFDPNTINITPMDTTKRRAVDYAVNIQSYYDQHVEGKPLKEIDFNACNERLAILCVLNGIFGLDVPEEAEENDPLISITSPLKEKYQSICDAIEGQTVESESQ